MKILSELRSGECRFSMFETTEDGRPLYHFCSQPVAEKDGKRAAYCWGHVQVCYVLPAVRAKQKALWSLAGMAYGQPGKAATC